MTPRCFAVEPEPAETGLANGRRHSGSCQDGACDRADDRQLETAGQAKAREPDASGPKLDAAEVNHPSLKPTVEP